MKKERFMKNGMFSLEYDKETLRDIILELQEENQKQKEIIDKIQSLIKSKNNGTCIHNNEERGAYTFSLNFDEVRKFIWNLEDILNEVK